MHSTIKSSSPNSRYRFSINIGKDKENTPGDARRDHERGEESGKKHPKSPENTPETRLKNSLPATQPQPNQPKSLENVLLDARSVGALAVCDLEVGRGSYGRKIEGEGERGDFPARGG
ncbi:unnamed protein product [Linum trigynum]|uniref:Uncharacterized protein n=1 Tax=Linum trigynum TaxID=586398 RepID=A0AAV2CCT2_9ROSI